MKEVVRYSEAFKRNVVEKVESGIYWDILDIRGGAEEKRYQRTQNAGKVD
jgi:hypothetical protein